MDGKEASDSDFHTFTKVSTTSETEIGEVLHKVGYCKKIVAKSWLAYYAKQKYLY